MKNEKNMKKIEECKINIYNIIIPFQRFHFSFNFSTLKYDLVSFKYFNILNKATFNDFLFQTTF